MKRASFFNRDLGQRLGFSLLTLVALLTAAPIVAVVVYIVKEGAPAISWEFLTAMPRDGMRAGGILPAIVGTFYLTLGMAVFSVPLGIAAAIYLSEYARENWLTRLIRIAIINLAGIPSVVYGLFGLGLFVPDSEHFAWRDALADHPEDRSAASPAWNPDWCYS
jgi:phosphate transport system permease protein